MDTNRPIHALTGGVAAAVLAACTSTASPAPADEPTPSPTTEPTPTEEPTPSGAASPDPTETASPSESPTFEDGETCTNGELGYEVSYPGDWWANARIEPDDDALTPIPACQYFACDEIDLQPNAGLPGGLAIWFELREDGPQTDGEELSRDEITIDGRDAIVWEIEPAPQMGFIPEGSLVHQYHIELEDGSYLVATTDTIRQDESDYDDSTDILDRMMETIEIEDR